MFKYKWCTKSDLDAFLGLLFDGFSKVLAAVGIMIFSFGMPTEIVLGKILPGLSLATAFGNFWYAYEALTLAKTEKRQDVTAQPYGVGAGQVFGWLFLIIGPVFWETNNCILAWQVGLAACFIGGFIEIAGAFIGRRILYYTPMAALLGNLAAGAMVWLSLIGVLEIFSKPIIALCPFLILFTAYFGKVRMPYGLPAGVFSIGLGTMVVWLTGNVDGSKILSSIQYVKISMPGLAIDEILSGFQSIAKYLPIIIPLQIANFLTTLQGLESAAVAGDRYPVRRSMVMDGVGTVIGAVFGNPFPTTVYYGHPSWKGIGARAGYSMFNGMAYLLVGFTGVAGLLTVIIPYQVVMPVLVFVGISVASQAFTETKRQHIPVVLVAFLPLIAQYVLSAIEAGLDLAGKELRIQDLAVMEESSFPIRGVISLAQGAFLSSLLLAAIMTYIIDKNYKFAMIFSAISAVLSMIGLIHAPGLAWISSEGMSFAIIYMIFAVICWILEKNNTNSGVNEKSL